MSLDTVRVTMKALLNTDFMRKSGTAYQVNPDIIFRGTRNARLAILNDYTAEPKRQPTKEEQIKQLQDSIETLQRQLMKLQSSKDQKDSSIIDVEVESQLSFTEDGTIVQKTKEKKR